MTAYRFVTLTCDNCGNVFDPGIQPSVAGCRAEAYRYGWRKIGHGIDLCGICFRVRLAESK